MNTTTKTPIKVARGLATVALLSSVSTSEGAMFGSFNPFNMMSKMAKCGSKVASAMWKYGPDEIGKKIPPFKVGIDCMSRATILGLQLRRAIMKYDFGMTDIMMLYGWKSYNEMMNAMDTMMPGSKDFVEGAMAEGFKVILSDEDLTKELLKDAEKYEGLVRFMKTIAEEDEEINKKLSVMMSSSKDTTKRLLRIAIKNKTMARFFFENMDNTGFRGITYWMAKDKEIAKLGTQLFAKYPDLVMDKNSKFGNVFFNPENSDYVALMMYGVLRDSKAFQNFIDFILYFKNSPEKVVPIFIYVLYGILPDGSFIGDEKLNEIYYGLIFGMSYRYDDLKKQITNNINALVFSSPDYIDIINQKFGTNIDRDIIVDFFNLIINPPIIIGDKPVYCKPLEDVITKKPVKKFMDKFFPVLLTGAYIYNYKEAKELFKKIKKDIMPFFDNCGIQLPYQPDPNIKPSRIKLFLAKNIKEFFDVRKFIDEKNIYSSDLTNYGIKSKWLDDVKEEYFEFKPKGKKVYYDGDDDKWLFIPRWLSPATWIRLNNREEFRKLDSSIKIGEINLQGKPGEYEYLVFIVASQYAPFPKWAINKGFKVIPKSEIETENQTGFILLAKVMKSGETVELFGNEGGDFHYVVGLMRAKTGETPHPIYTYAKNKILMAPPFSTEGFVETVKDEGNHIRTIYHSYSINFTPIYISTSNIGDNTTVNCGYDLNGEDKGFVALDKFKGIFYANSKAGFSSCSYSGLPDIDRNDEYLALGIASSGDIVLGIDDEHIWMSEVNGWIDLGNGKNDMYDAITVNDNIYMVGENGRIINVDTNQKNFNILNRNDTKTKDKDLMRIRYIDSLNKYFIVGEQGRIVSTEDFTNWNIEVKEIKLKSILGIKKEPKFSITDIIYTDNKYIAITDIGVVLVSQDLKHWTAPIKADRMTPLTSIEKKDDIIIITGLNGIVFLSKDGGNTWDDTKFPTYLSFMKVIPKENEDTFLLLAKNGSIIEFKPYSITGASPKADQAQGMIACSMGNSNSNVYSAFIIAFTIASAIFIRRRTNFSF